MAFFAVPARGDNGLQEILNAFLRSHRVLTLPTWGLEQSLRWRSGILRSTVRRYGVL